MTAEAPALPATHAMGTVIVRTPNWLGDTVMALPALRALRRQWPAARITLVGRWAELLAGQGIGDLVLPYPSAIPERRRLNRALGRLGADLAILLPSSFESARAAWQWRARRRLGFDTDTRGPLLTDRVPLPSPRAHQVDEYAWLVEAAGVTVSDRTPAWTLHPDPERDREVDDLLAGAGLAPGPRIVGLHLGASFGPSKLWPAASFGRLAARLAAATLNPVLLGGPGDGETAAAAAAAAPRAPASLVGKDRPALLPRLLSRLACLVSGDTGVAHLAAALGVPTIALFGPTDPDLTAPRAAAARVVALGAPCAPCFLATCPIDHGCLAGIDVEAVERHVRQLAAA